MIRLFVGLSLPSDVRQRLAAMSGGVPGARWEPEENFHLTLRFIGEVEHGQADDVHGELSKLHMPGFEIILSAIDWFGSGDNARVLYVGVDKNEMLQRLQNKVENAVQRAGLPPETRKWRPHVTLARLRDTPPQRLAAFREAYNLFRAGPIPVREFALFSSHPGKGNAVYHEEATYGLGEN
jgi:2'-5' RNA ligase